MKLGFSVKLSPYSILPVVFILVNGSKMAIQNMANVIYTILFPYASDKGTLNTRSEW
jgi:hypothetical protein